MRDTMAQALSSVAAGVSFLLLWLAFATLWLAIVIRIFRNRDGHKIFGLRKKSTLQALDALTKAGNGYFATRAGRLHGITLGTLIITTVLFGFWYLVENKGRTATSILETMSVPDAH